MLLFGSHAKGRQTAASDVDLAVEGLGVTDVLAFSAKLSEVLGCEVDVVRLEEASIPLLAEIVESGELIFERFPGAGAAWRSHALGTLEIDKPWFERMQRAWLARVAESGLSGSDKG